MATGKALGPWRANVLPYLGHSLPGVYLQGLLVADADGKALYSKELPNDVLAQCIAMAESHGEIFFCGCQLGAAFLPLSCWIAVI